MNSSTQNIENKIYLTYPPYLKANRVNKLNLTIFSVGYFLQTESVGGGDICPPNVFLDIFSKDSFNNFVPLFVLLA